MTCELGAGELEARAMQMLVDEERAKAERKERESEIRMRRVRKAVSTLNMIDWEHGVSSTRQTSGRHLGES